MSFERKSYHYTLPNELIAQEAVHPHHDARLLVVDRKTGEIEIETTFYNLNQIIPENRVIFFNNSRVIPSRLRLKNAEYKSKYSNGIIKDGEIFFLSQKDNNCIEALVKPGNKFKLGTEIHAFGTLFHVEKITETGRILRCDAPSIVSILEQYGELPLPPYIDYKKVKESDYQTIFARHDGSVAAPTASLHFTQELLDKLTQEKEYITLHVGLGTFQGINTDDIRDYAIHNERIEIPLSIFERIYHIKNSHNKIVAVGTTVCRTLESLVYLWKDLEDTTKKMLPEDIRSYWEKLSSFDEKPDFIHNKSLIPESNIFQFETSIYITPGHEFRVIDELITNFHLPESSLLVLVSSFLGYNETMQLYQKALEKKYRFYSFGDGMYIRVKS